MVLGPGGQDERSVALVSRLDRGGNQLGGVAGVIDAAVLVIPVLDRASGGAGAGQEPHGLGNAGWVAREAPLAVD